MGPLDKKPVPIPPSLNLWRFTYKDGPAPMTAHVEATSEAEGYAVACRWCELQGFRPPARVFPFIVAGVDILDDAPKPLAVKELRHA
jgi:hypothetical protein